MNRDEIIERVRSRQQPWDIIVIGGGATGVGCALDAASRGYDALLVEQHDFGKGTSSRSTKLIHGGVRYLAQGDIAMVRESLKERAILLRNAPHVVHRQEFIVPCYSLWQKIYYGAGLKIYDLLAGKSGIGRSQILSRSETLRRLSTIKTANLSGSVLYHDAQFDDTRLLIDLVTTAHKQGAAVLNYARVSDLIKDEKGSVRGVNFQDVETGDEFDALAKVVINASGAFCDAVRRMSDGSAQPIVTLSQGIHVVVDRRFLPDGSALMIPQTSDGRVLFCIPWHDHTLIGTTDTPIDEAHLEAQALESEIDFILSSVSEYLADAPTRKDILSVFAGIRPLVKNDAAKNTASLARGHMIEIDESGLLTITGGKWTTYRRMAEDAVDQAAKLAGLTVRSSQTSTLVISGPTPPPSKGAELLHADLPYTHSDLLRAVRVEVARTVEDVLARRTRALFLNASASIQMAPSVAETMAGELGKDNEWAERQVTDFSIVAANYFTPSI